ncbi:hypothetical protein E6O75_ATG10533 [Venturia nashicola]|uniref:VOC domain-containing protein n=1 Tax=Venturia nashicola TaxID=86259 RepID=A0A4Z1NSQ1_9PEZI|nr:hypothetical protein E6O75_ATG10533 [Venturia nashicola]
MILTKFFIITALTLATSITAVPDQQNQTESARAPPRFLQNVKPVGHTKRAPGAPPKIGHMLETCLYIRRMEVAVNFYKDILGLENYMTTKRLSGFNIGPTTLLLFHLGDTMKDQNYSGTPGRGQIAGHGPDPSIINTLGLQNSTVAPKNGTNHPEVSLKLHYALAVEKREDVFAWEAHLAKNNVHIHSTMDWDRGGRSVYFYDPDGHVGEIVRRFVSDEFCHQAAFQQQLGKSVDLDFVIAEAYRCHPDYEKAHMKSGEKALQMAKVARSPLFLPVTIFATKTFLSHVRLCLISNNTSILIRIIMANFYNQSYYQTFEMDGRAAAYQRFCDDNEMYNPDLRITSPTDQQRKDFELLRLIRSFFFDDKDNILLPLFQMVARGRYWNGAFQGDIGDTEKLWLQLLKREFKEEECSFRQLTSPTIGRVLELLHNDCLVLTVNFMIPFLPDGPIIQYCHNAHYVHDRLNECEWVTCIRAFGLCYEHFRCVKSGAGRDGFRPFVRRDNMVERGGFDGFIDDEGNLIQDIEEGLSPMDSSFFNLTRFDGLSVMEKVLMHVRDRQFPTDEELVTGSFTFHGWMLTQMDGCSPRCPKPAELIKRSGNQSHQGSPRSNNIICLGNQFVARAPPRFLQNVKPVGHTKRAPGAPPKIGHMLETCLYIRRMEVAVNFYKDILGLENYMTTKRLSGFNIGPTTLLLFHLGDTMKDQNYSGTPGRGQIAGHGPDPSIINTLGLQNSTVAPKNGTNHPEVSLKLHYALAVEKREDVFAWEAHLAKNNVHIHSTMDWDRGGRSVYFYDPDGHVGEIVRRFVSDEFCHQAAFQQQLGKSVDLDFVIAEAYRCHPDYEKAHMKSGEKALQMAKVARSPLFLPVTIFATKTFLSHVRLCLISNNTSILIRIIMANFYNQSYYQTFEMDGRAAAYQRFCDDNEMYNPDLRITSPTDQQRKDFELLRLIRSFFFDDKDNILLPLFQMVARGRYWNGAFQGDIGDTEKLWLQLLKREFKEEECSFRQLTSPTIGRVLELLHNDCLVLTVNFMIPFLPDGPIIQYCHNAHYVHDRLNECEWVTCIRAFGLCYEHFRCVKSGAGRDGFRPFVRRDNMVERGGFDGFIDDEGNLIQDIEEGLSPMDSSFFNLTRFDGLSVMEKVLMHVRDRQFPTDEEL